MKIARKRQIVSKETKNLSGGRWSETVTFDDGLEVTNVWMNEIYTTDTGEMISVKKKVDAPAIASEVAENIAGNRGGEGETLWNMPEKKSGYVVGGKIQELIFPWDVTDEILGDLVSDHFRAHRTAVTLADCAGWWRYRGNIHVDVNDWVKDLATARALGMARKQIAIWDIANGCEIVL